VREKKREREKGKKRERVFHQKFSRFTRENNRKSARLPSLSLVRMSSVRFLSRSLTVMGQGL
jgi:hypothetical protein